MKIFDIILMKLKRDLLRRNSCKIAFVHLRNANKNTQSCDQDYQKFPGQPTNLYVRTLFEQKSNTFRQILTISKTILRRRLIKSLF